jgi:hypothetical protein
MYSFWITSQNNCEFKPVCLTSIEEKYGRRRHKQMVFSKDVSLSKNQLLIELAILRPGRRIFCGLQVVEDTDRGRMEGIISAESYA